MPYDTFEFYSGVHISSFQFEYVYPIKKPQSTQAGYVEVAPSDVRGRWRLLLDMDLITAEYFIYLIDFFQSHVGEFFYLKIPFGMAGIPEEAYIARPGGVHPWDSEVTPGAGEGPTFLVFWNQDTLPIKRKFQEYGTVEHYWETASSIEFLQV